MKNYTNLTLLALLYFGLQNVQSQVLTHEDSLAAGLQIRGNKATAISGYGEVFYKHDFNDKTGVASLRRNVLFIGHRFNEKLSFFSEMEIENAKIEGGKPSGELSLEQCFLKFDINRNLYINAGFFTPRIGIMNENHLPTTFNGNERPQLEQWLIPATWREVGVALYGSSRNLPSLNYSIALMNGLNAEGFSLEEGIRGGRGEGVNAQARQKAVTAAVLYYRGPFRFQLSSFYGGSVGLDNFNSDFLGLNSGAFGTPVMLNEFNVQYRKKGWTVKAIATQTNIRDAAAINTAYANNTPETMRGAYIDIAKNLWFKRNTTKQLLPFVRYEWIDMNAKVPVNGIVNQYFTQHHVFAGFMWMPHPGVGVKMDYHYAQSGAYNTSLIINPTPYAKPWYTNRHEMNLGICYSF